MFEHSTHRTTSTDRVYDSITSALAAALQCPMAAIGLIDEDRMFFKSTVGPLGCTNPRDGAICPWILVDDKPGPLIIEDCRTDRRFAGMDVAHPDKGNIRFYAGVPLISSSGMGLGSLCVMDTSPRQVNETQIKMLASMGDMVMAEMEQRKVGQHPHDFDAPYL